MHNFVLDGETIKLYADFVGFDGGHIDPDDITLIITDSANTELLNVGITSHYKESAGVYCYEFAIPQGFRGELTYEYRGYINGSPIVIRRVIEVVKDIPNTTQPSLYGI